MHSEQECSQRYPKVGEFIVVSINPEKSVAPLHDAEATRVAQQMKPEKYVAFVAEVSDLLVRFIWSLIGFSIVNTFFRPRGSRLFPVSILSGQRPSLVRWGCGSKQALHVHSNSPCHFESS